jgi:hypothetical protein
MKAIAYIEKKGTEGPCTDGCVEDALMMAIYGKSWFYPTHRKATIQDTEEMDLVKRKFYSHPLYLWLMARLHAMPSWKNVSRLYIYSDHISKHDRIAFLQSALEEIENGNA